MNCRYFLVVIVFLLFSYSLDAQRKNGKVTIEIEKGGVEKGKVKNGLREGTWKSYNSKGELIQEENFLHGKRDGAMKRTEDSVATTGSYTAGQKNGRFTTTVNKRVVSDISYKMDTLHGKYYVSGETKTISGSHYLNRKTGVWIIDSIDYRKKRILDTTNYANGVKHGISVTYEDNILITRSEWAEGQRNGFYEEHDAVTGRMITKGTYKSGERDGLWYTYRNGFLYSVEDFENGIHASNTIIYGSDTTIIAAIESYCPNGEKKLTQYNDGEGNVQQRRYYNRDGNTDSIIKYWPSGKIRETHYTAYVNNDGVTQFYLFQSYHTNEKIACRGYEHKDARTGKWIMYDSTGKQTESIHYDEGTAFGWYSAYHSNGKLKLQAYCYQGVTDTILVYANTGARLPQSNPAYSKTIDQVQSVHPEIWFRDPNKFPPDHHRKGFVSLGEPVTEGRWSDEPAMFPGGSDSLNIFIKRTIRYPEPERRLSKQGEVHIKFLVEKDGTLSDIQIVKEVQGAPGFTKETMRLMRAMPKWIPAKTGGKIVRVYYTLPVRFSLE